MLMTDIHKNESKRAPKTHRKEGIQQITAWGYKVQAILLHIPKGSPTEKVAGSIRALPKWGGGGSKF